MKKYRVIVNPILCDGRGLCAELLPERIVLDDWGYPMVSDEPVANSTLEHAKRACESCPVGALSLMVVHD